MATPIPSNRARLSGTGAQRVTSGELRGDGAREHQGITTDSRAITAGGIFVALRGERHDGHAFVETALAGGATLLVVERTFSPPADLRGADVLFVDDTLVAWGALAHFHLERWRAGGEKRVIAITGSVGKTTTKELCAALLSAAGGGPSAVVATHGNLNNRIGMPAMIFTLGEAHTHVVLECGMSLPGEMDMLGRIAEPDVSAVTNVGLSHAENVGGTREGVGREKGALYRNTKAGGTLVISADDALVAAVAAPIKDRRRVTFGRESGADVRLELRRGDGFRGSTLRVVRDGVGLELALPIVGEGAAIDFVCALAAAEAGLGRPLSSEEVDAALRSLPPSPGRANVRVRSDGLVVVDDTYNASPQSMQNALDSLSELASAESRRAVCVLGEMRELGPTAAAAHDELGESVARAGVSLFVGCGGLVDRALERARSRGVRVIATMNAEAAAQAVRAEVSAGDVVLVKGSRAVGTERVVASLFENEATSEHASERESEGGPGG